MPLERQAILFLCMELFKSALNFPIKSLLFIKRTKFVQKKESLCFVLNVNIITYATTGVFHVFVVSPASDSDVASSTNVYFY